MNMRRQPDILDLVNDIKAKGEPFAIATVVRTVSVTAAKAGAKAVISADGTITEGWIGGGCARGAVLKAAREALEDGQPRLVSIQPADLLQEMHVAAGQVRDGVLYARNNCPSQGTMDIFVEAILPRPNLVICGASPVAVAIADLGQRMGFFTTICTPLADHVAFGNADRFVDGFSIPTDGTDHGFVVIATQGKGDSAALKAAIQAPSKYLAFVGSRKKAASLKSDLVESGLDAALFDRIRAPAGLDIGAITPDEIAFSIIAEIIEYRRRGQRTA
jgi:xanthine dehydrogenase accessory factor